MSLASLLLPILVLAPAASAVATFESDVTSMVSALPTLDTSKQHLAFTFTDDAVFSRGAQERSGQANFGGEDITLEQLDVGLSSDGATGWFAAVVQGQPTRHECAPEPCPPNREPPLQATGLLEKVGKDWRWVMWHITPPVTAKEQAALLARKVVPDVLPGADGAPGPAALMESALRRPADLQTLIADDAMLVGSARGERYVGGAKVKKQLAAWKLTFTVRDGMQSGFATTRRVAWVAANVDAVGKKHAAPYRVSAILRLEGTRWRIALLHFSVVKR